MVRGEQGIIDAFAARHGLVQAADSTCGLISSSFGVAEVMVPPRSDLVGTEVYPGMVTESGDLVVLSHQRPGHPATPAAPASTRGTPCCSRAPGPRWTQHTADPDVMLVDSPMPSAARPFRSAPGALPALAVLGAHGPDADHIRPRPGAPQCWPPSPWWCCVSSPRAGAPFDGMADPDPRRGHDPAFAGHHSTGTAAMIAEACLGSR